MAIKKKIVNQKMKILMDFGVSESLVRELFKNKEFESLRALDCFADNILRNKFREEEAKTKASVRKVG